MFLIPDTYPVMPSGRWDIPPQGHPPASHAPSLGHGIHKSLGYDLVACVGWVNFKGIGIVAFDKKQPGPSLKGAVKIGDPDATTQAHILEYIVDLGSHITHHKVKPTNDCFNILVDRQRNAIQVAYIYLDTGRICAKAHQDAEKITAILGQY